MKYVSAASQYDVDDEGQLQGFPEAILRSVPTSDSDKEIFKCFLDFAMPAVNKSAYKKQMYFDTLSEVVSVGEETFAFLVVENNIERWVYMAETILSNQHSNHLPPAGVIPKVRYQKEVKQRKDEVHTAGKWTNKGLQRFNEIASLVHNSRNMRTDYENELKSKYEEDFDESLMPRMLLK